MPWFLHTVFITSCFALMGAIASVVLLFLERPALAHGVAKRATAIAVVVLGVALAELWMIWVAPGLAGPLVARILPVGDPSEKARALAEGISEIMNCAALAIPAVVLGSVGWVVARWQIKRSLPEDRE